MTTGLSLRTAFNGYNKKDVEELFSKMKIENEKQVEELKKQFDEAMKVIDEYEKQLANNA